MFESGTDSEEDTQLAVFHCEAPPCIGPDWFHWFMTVRKTMTLTAYFRHDMCCGT